MRFIVDSPAANHVKRNHLISNNTYMALHVTEQKNMEMWSRSYLVLKLSEDVIRLLHLAICWYFHVVIFALKYMYGEPRLADLHRFRPPA